MARNIEKGNDLFVSEFYLNFLPNLVVERIG